MTEATAYRLKQIMTQEHLSLTQAAKQIGISASSMRKALKDTPMSRPITFKINRFIDEHPVQQSRNSFTIFDSAEAEAKTTSPKPANKPAKRAKATDQKTAPVKQAKQTVKAPAKRDAGKAKQNQPEPNSEASQPRRRGRRQPDHSETSSAPKQSRRTAKPSRQQATGNSQAQPASQPAEAKQQQSQSRSRRSHTAESESQPTRRRRTGRSAAAQHQTPAHQQDSQAAEPEPAQRSQTASAATPASASSLTNQPTAPTTVPTSAAAERAESHPNRQDLTILIYMDESFGGGSDYQRNMSIGATVVDPDDDQALIPFMETLYPFGWQPGDEVKARGKAREQLESMLRHANTDRVTTYAVYSPLSDTGNFSLSFGILYPYVAALIRILDALPTKPTKVRVAMDQRSEITDEQLAMAARMLHAYVKAQTGRDVIFMFRTTDSKQTIGVQYSDFVSHAAMIFGPDQIASTGINKLPAIGTEVGDQLQLYAMVGLQKYLLDDSPAQSEAPQPFKNPLLNAADRMTHLAEKAADLPDTPEETFTQAKLVVNQLLQIAPSAVSGAINKMPFQSWYDILARTAAILHYTDESLPPFRIDPDAMQIATDALNNIQALLAGAR